MIGGMVYGGTHSMEFGQIERRRLGGLQCSRYIDETKKDVQNGKLSYEYNDGVESVIFVPDNHSPAIPMAWEEFKKFNKDCGENNDDGHMVKIGAVLKDGTRWNKRVHESAVEMSDGKVTYNSMGRTHRSEIKEITHINEQDAKT